MRILVYSDYAYHRDAEGQLLSERAFSLFVAAVAERCRADFTLLGRVSPAPTGGHYPIGDRVELVELPYYPALTSPEAAPRLLAALRRLWQVAGDADVVWALGPHPLAVALAWFAIIRRRRLVLGVRQDSLAYVKSRHPGRRMIAVAAWLLEAGFRAAARWAPVVAVGPEIARRYRHSREVLTISVSLVDAARIVSPLEAARRSFEAPRTILSVGRLETEKNPLLLAELLRLLNARQPGQWRLIVCGEGDLATALGARLEQLGVGDLATLAGYVPFGPQLEGYYRAAHVLVSCSWTEGLPQVILEALAAGVAVVSSDVGGIGQELGDVVGLVEPGSAEAMADAVGDICADATERDRRARAGHDYMTQHTIDSEADRVAGLLTGRVEPSESRLR